MLLQHYHHGCLLAPARPAASRRVCRRLHRVPRAQTDTRGPSDADFQQLLREAGLTWPGESWLDVVHSSASPASSSSVAERAGQMLELLSTLQLNKQELQALVTR